MKGALTMPKFHEQLRMLRKETGLSQQAFAQQLGISKSSVNMYERGEREPSFEILETLAAYFQVDVDFLLGKSEHRSKQDWLDSNLTDWKKPAKVRRINVLGSVPAGVPMEAVEDIIDWEEIPEEMCAGGKEYFGLRVKGDSMWPVFLEGDTVIVQKTPVCENGDTCVVYVNGYDATLKTVKLGEDGSLTLLPKNPNYAPRTYTAKEVRETPVSIAGIVVELRRKLK